MTSVTTGTGGQRGSIPAGGDERPEFGPTPVAYWGRGR